MNAEGEDRIYPPKAGYHLRMDKVAPDRGLYSSGNIWFLPNEDKHSVVLK